MKYFILALIANFILSGSVLAQYTCAANNKVVIPSGNYCCCNPNTATATTNDYVCTVKPTQCVEPEKPSSFVENKGTSNEKKVCPCILTIQ